MATSARYALDEAVDFVVVGSGAAGGILAKELSTSGFDVVVLEQGPFRRASEFVHDEVAVLFRHELLGGGTEISGQTFRRDASETATRSERPPAEYAQGVGGSSVHFTANFWRFRESDFVERSRLGRDRRHQFRRLAASPTRNSSPTTRRSTGRSASPARRARTMRRARKPYPAAAAAREVVGRADRARREEARAHAPVRRRTRSCRSLRTAGRPASTAATACSSAARSAQSPRRSRR